MIWQWKGEGFYGSLSLGILGHGKEVVTASTEEPLCLSLCTLSPCSVETF